MGHRVNGGVIGPYINTTSTAAAGVWSMNAAAQRQARNNTQTADVWPPAKDASFSSVKGLWHFQSIDKGVVPDASGNNNVTMNAGIAGNVANGLTTAFTKWGVTTYFVGGNGNGLTKGALGSALDFGTGDWTMEAWFYALNNNTNQVIFDLSDNDNNKFTPFFRLNSTNKLLFLNNPGGGVTVTLTGTTTVTANAWHHGIVSRVSSVTWMGLDGAQEATNADSTTYICPAIYIGQLTSTNSGIQGFSGYFSDMRITKGVGRYAGGAYTVPTAPFPDY